MYGVALAGTLSLVSKDLLFTPIYGAITLGKRGTVFLRDLGVLALATTAFAGICYGASFCLSDWTWARLVVFGSVLAAGFFAAAYQFMLTAEEKSKAVELLPSSVARRFGFEE
jgi:hypothetical protein